MSSRFVLVAVSVAGFALAHAAPAMAACTRLAFSVNDYGKDGPARDAKSLLDKYVAKWTADRGIKKYTTGPKDVSCELFLNFIVFDEHTCTASANVCWEGSMPSGASADAKPDTPFVNKAAATPGKAKTAPAAGNAASGAAAPAAQTGITTGSVKPAVPAKAPAAAPAAPAQKSAAPVTVAPPAAAAVVVPSAPAAPLHPVPAAPAAAAPAGSGN